MTAQSRPVAAGDAPPADARGAVAGSHGAAEASDVRVDEPQLSWEGDLDVASAPVLASALHVLGDLGVRRVVLDLSAVAFMDCAGLGALLEADTRLADGLRLVRPSGAVLRLLALVGLTDRFATTDLAVPPTSIPDTRAAIERSKGLIMGSYGCTPDQASKILLSTALQQNVQVQVLASLLVMVTSSDLGHPAGGPARAVQRVMGSTSPT